MKCWEKKKKENAGIVLYSKNEIKPFCTVCKKNNHTAEKCWFKIGFPSRTNKNKQHNKNFDTQGAEGFYGKGKNQGSYGGQNYKKKAANNAQLSVASDELATTIAKQLQNMMKLGGSSSNVVVKQFEDTNEEIDNYFARMISCHYVKNMNNTYKQKKT